jgi:hypothetical protein
LPLPSCRMSRPANAFASITPVGIAPMKYEAAMRSKYRNVMMNYFLSSLDWGFTIFISHYQGPPTLSPLTKGRYRGVKYRGI